MRAGGAAVRRLSAVESRTRPARREILPGPRVDEASSSPAGSRGGGNVTATIRTANVSLGYQELMTLIGELDARIHDLGLQSEKERRTGGHARASAMFERREEVVRLREYLHACARTMLVEPADVGAATHP
jgi:hypothetical protein